MRKINIKYFSALIILASLFVACQDDLSEELDEYNPMGYADEYFTGGSLGTTTINGNLCFEQPSLAVSNAGLSGDFMRGEAFFEDAFVSEKNSGYAMLGVGPLSIRKSCIACHPGYGHGKRIGNLDDSPKSFITSGDGSEGNGYLLVVYTAGSDGVFGTEETLVNSEVAGPAWVSTADDDKYSTSLTGMPQTQSISPFPSPLDESKIKITWVEHIDEWGNKYADGTSYQLIYPEVTFEQGAIKYPDAFTELTDGNYKVKLEATIGIYGTGLIDAITEEDIDAEYESQKLYTWGGRRGASIAQLDGTTRKGRYTYGLTRGTLQHGPGSNALWNITNVTRETSNPLYRTNYMTTAYAGAVIEDAEVMQSLKDDSYYSFLIGSDDITSQAAKNRVYNYLLYNNTYDGGQLTGQNFSYDVSAGTDANNYTNYIDYASQRNAELSLEEYTQFMVWHRGLAVPSARNVGTDTYEQGKALFYSDALSCTGCHRPSWTTGADNYVGDADMDGKLPKYPYQKIWPYSDFLQHNLGMKNNIRTGWCRTTPLWGRYLNKVANGESSHLHDMRARDYYEAIMWHKGQGKYSSDAFRRLSSDDRDALVYFLKSI